METEKTLDNTQDSEKIPMIEEIKEEFEDRPIKEYNETLYSKGSGQKQPLYISDRKQSLKRTSWEDSKTIELNIDNMGRRLLRPSGSSIKTQDDTDKKVDRILLKKKGRV
jgi:hypothetical protein